MTSPITCLAQIAVVAGFAFIYLAARPLVGTLGALASVLIIDGLHYLNYTSAKFNHDVVQLPFWALAGFAFHRALRGRQNADWLLLGLAVGLSLWAKYFVLVLAVPLALFVFIDRDARKTLATPGPYIAIAAALVTMAPHLIWLVNNDFLPFAYAEHRAVLSRGWYDHLWHPLQFAISQLFFLIPALLIAAPLFYPRAVANEAPAATKRRRLRPPHRHFARLRSDGDGAGAVGRQRPRHRGDVGLSALAVPWVMDRARRAARARWDKAQPPGADLGDRVLLLRRSPSSPITPCCPVSITVTARCSSPAATSAAKSRSAIAPSPASRSSMSSAACGTAAISSTTRRATRAF